MSNDIEYEAYRLTMLESAIWELKQFQKQVLAWQRDSKMPIGVVANKVASVLSMAALASRECYEKMHKRPGPAEPA